MAIKKVKRANRVQKRYDVVEEELFLALNVILTGAPPDPGPRIRRRLSMDPCATGENDPPPPEGWRPGNVLGDALVKWRNWTVKARVITRVRNSGAGANAARTKELELIGLECTSTRFNEELDAGRYIHGLEYHAGRINWSFTPNAKPDQAGKLKFSLDVVQLNTIEGRLGDADADNPPAQQTARWLGARWRLHELLKEEAALPAEIGDGLRTAD